MFDIVGLVLPLFGLIFLGYFVARVTRQPLEALGWMNTFIVYLALPALFIQLLAKTPIEQLSQWSYVVGSLLATFLVFAVMFCGSVLVSRGETAEGTIKGLAAAYGNVGYMGPAIAIIVLGEQAAVPVALIICFESIMHFTLTPAIMAVSRSDGTSAAGLIAGVARKILLNPLILGVAIGVAMAWLQFQAPLPLERLLDYLARAAAPCALFAMGVSIALRPLTRVPRELAAIVPLKLAIHPLLAYVIVSWVGDFGPGWIYAAVLMAALPTATNVFVLAQQYGVWVQRASASVLVTTVVSVFTLTGLIYAITSGLLPPDLFPER